MANLGRIRTAQDRILKDILVIKAPSWEKLEEFWWKMLILVKTGNSECFVQNTSFSVKNLSSKTSSSWVKTPKSRVFKSKMTLLRQKF